MDEKVSRPPPPKINASYARCVSFMVIEHCLFIIINFFFLNRFLKYKKIIKNVQIHKIR